MATIHVREKFHFTDKDGNATAYAIGTHTNVPDEVANHPFVKAHCTDMPLLAQGDALAAQVNELTAERDVARAQGRAAREEIDALTAQVSELTAERDALTAQVAALNDQIADLQAGSDPAPAAGGKKK